MGTRARLAVALGVAFCLILVLSGMTLLLSQNALPGDPLYAVRRTVESATLGLTVGNESKGRKHLEFAADRIGDIESLVARYPDLHDSPVGNYLTAFGDFDADAAAGSADLTGFASGNGPADLGSLRDWATEQSGRIAGVRPKLPGEAASRADHSSALLTRIQQRAAELMARTSCYTVTTGASDDIGVLPATGPCDRAPGGVTSTGSGLPLQPTQPSGVLAPGPTRDDGPTVLLPTGTANPPSRPKQVGGGSGQPTGGPTSPSSAPGPGNPVPVPPTPTITLPLPLSGLGLPPLLPGLPSLLIGQ